MRSSIGALTLALAAMAPFPALAQENRNSEARSPRPNVLVWMLDDVGYAQLSCFGGLVETPNIDRVAAMGLRYANYHTAPICSASRAAFLTGRNPHSVHMGGHAAAPRPYPGYDSKLPADAATVAANFKAAGYATFALGKWDHLPTGEMTPAGPFRRWPTGQGFERYYGFLAFDTDQWTPVVVRDTTPVAVPQSPNYHLDRDLAGQAIAMISGRSASAERRPFFMYYATGTAHAPHHAPADWIARYKGKFDAGWDVARETILQREIERGLVPASTKLAPRPEGMAAWADLAPGQRRLYARQMEVFAAALSHADAQFGRVLDALEAGGELDDTIVVVTSDNGASAEGAFHGTYNEYLFANNYLASVEENLARLEDWGGPKTYPHYSFGWAVAGNTPFRYYKQTAHEGGTRVPLVVAWPKGIPARGEVRHQFVDVIDVAPTLMALSRVPLAERVEAIAQRPMEGASFAATLADAKAPEPRQAQYFEMYGNKGLWSKGWSIVTSHRTATWEMLQTKSPEEDPWELYDLNADPGQTADLAAKRPDKVRELARIFDREARRYNVYPIGTISESRPYMQRALQHEFTRRGGRWTFPGPASHINEGAAPPTNFRAFRMTVGLNLPTGRETGPIYAQGGALGGMGLYLKDGAPRFVLRGFDGRETLIAARAPLAKGRSTIELDFARKPAAILAPQDIPVTIRVDGRTVAASTVRFAMPYMFSMSETFDLGIDWGRALSDDYEPGTPFPGTIGPVTFDFNRPSSK